MYSVFPGLFLLLTKGEEEKDEEKTRKRREKDGKER
jgi:hypothetical protein